MLAKPDVWDALQALELDDADASFPFSERLAQENGWSAGHTAQVIGEYKRFAYLASVSPVAVTPSDAVDQAWHLHLVYTRHYWGPFRAALGRDLHHGPTAGGAAEDARYRDQYEHTLALYRAEFGDAPPADIWPDADQRFAHARFVRTDLARNWVVPKPGRGLAAMAVLAAAGTSLLAAAGDLSFAQGEGGVAEAETPAAMLLAAITLFGLLAYFAYRIGRAKGRKRGGKKTWWGGNGCGAGCGSGCGGGGCGG